MPLLSVAGWSTGHFLEAGKGECDTVIFHERVGQAALWSTWQHVSARHWFRSGAGSLKGPGSVGELGHQFHTHLIFLQAYAKYSVCVCVCVCVYVGCRCRAQDKPLESGFKFQLCELQDLKKFT